MQKNIQKEFFISLIIESEFVALKLSLLRTEYLYSAVNLLTNSPKILHISKTSFCQLNYLNSDH